MDTLDIIKEIDLILDGDCASIVYLSISNSSLGTGKTVIYTSKPCGAYRFVICERKLGMDMTLIYVLYRGSIRSCMAHI